MSEFDPCSTQAQRFLRILETMTAESQQSFRKIYELAPRKHSAFTRGHHVRVAMVEAVLHSGIAYWVKMNLAIRIALKFSKMTGHQSKARRLTDLLEAFHAAADAFILKISVEQATQHRNIHRQWKNVFPFPQVIEGTGWVSDEELTQIQQFKQNIIPGFVGAIRQTQQRIQS
jgi:hypothetical protein